jgi:tRNA (cytidine/uridine-2'-O-)-methyltransferase
VEIALYQPDIPQNAGAVARLAACLGVPLHIVEPAGFDVSDRNFRRAGMDYLERAGIVRHVSWDAFLGWRTGRAGRLLLATTRGAASYLSFSYAQGDVLLFGRESAGVPDAVHAAADARLVVPMRPGLRSLNVAQTAAMILGEALRQTGGFPGSDAADTVSPP